MGPDQDSKDRDQHRAPARDGGLAPSPAPSMFDAARGGIGAHALQRKISQRQKKRGRHEETEAAAEAAPRIVGRTAEWYVFDRPLMRHEVVAFFWGSGFLPTSAELYGEGEDDLVGYTERWALARTGVAARPECWRLLRPEALAQMDAPMQAQGERPAWVPEPVWADFLASHERMKRYPDASPTGTAIVMARSPRGIACYTEAIADEAALTRQLYGAPLERRRTILGEETVEESRVRWLAAANKSYNEYVRQAVASGMTPQEARQRHHDAVHQAYLAAFTQAIGFLGSGASFSSQATTLVETGRAAQQHR